MLPCVLAQDAEGESEWSLGGWGLGVAFPPPSEVVRVFCSHMGRGLPNEADLNLRHVSALAWDALTDHSIPDSWTNGSVAWHDLLARAHSYPEHITISESRVLLRSLQVLSKILHLHHSRVLALEDNSAVRGAWQKGRSRSWQLTSTPA